MTQPPHRSTHEPRATVAGGARASCISEIVGDVRCADGRNGVAYRALREIVCTGCGAPVAAGELFTRWRLAAASRFAHIRENEPPRLAARCRACVPFVEGQLDASRSQVTGAAASDEADEGSPRASARRSPLITNLLDGAGAKREAANPVTRPGSSSHNGSTPERPAAETLAADAPPVAAEAAREAAYRRLAPALHSGRQSSLRSGAFRKTVPVGRKF